MHHVAQPLAARRQITFFDEPVGGASFGSDPAWFLLSKDVGGTEASQIYRFDLTTGEAALLTDGTAQNGGPVWSNARDRVAWRSTARNGRDHDIWVMDPLHPEGKRMVLQVEGYFAPLDWSPDDRTLLVMQSVSANESYLWTVVVATGDNTPLATHG